MLYVLKAIVKYEGTIFMKNTTKSVTIGLKKALFFVLFALNFYAYSSDFEDGIDFLNSNKIDEAIDAFKSAMKSSECPQDIYLYVGVAYLKLGLYTQAIDSFARGKNKDVDNFHLYSFNMGNAFFAQNRFYDAEISYSEALSSGISYPVALLNRANARMKLGKYLLALKDYKRYLELSPNDEQEEEVKKMIAVLERVKMEEETAKADILAEATRRAEEAMRKAEEERQRKLLEELNSSLSSVERADSVSSGTEDTINYEEENDLD